MTDRVSLPKALETQHLVVSYKMLLKPLGIPVSESAPRLYLMERGERSTGLADPYGRR
ncbi:MAG: hypothetical protein LVR00_04695 [Rhabdochlamydiaceae bacterium]